MYYSCIYFYSLPWPFNSIVGGGDQYPPSPLSFLTIGKDLIV